jgi:hypothetical protein
MTTTAAVQSRSRKTPSAYSTGPSPKKVTSKMRMIKKACTKNFKESPPTQYLTIQDVVPLFLLQTVSQSMIAHKLYPSDEDLIPSRSIFLP